MNAYRACCDGDEITLRCCSSDLVWGVVDLICLEISPTQSRRCTFGSSTP